MPHQQRIALEEAWQNYKSCRDCKFWENDDPSLTYGSCGDAPKVVFVVPEDYTCNSFQSKEQK